MTGPKTGGRSLSAVDHRRMATRHGQFDRQPKRYTCNHGLKDF